VKGSDLSDNVLVLEQVGKIRLAPDGGVFTILSSIDLAIEEGSFTAIVGPSGGGKSTLVRLLNRLDDPTSGRILFRGRDITAIDPLSLRRRIGLVLQKPHMFEGTVLENLRLPFRFAGKKIESPNEQRLQDALDICQLPGDILNQTARNLSFGQQHRLSLARALLLEPEVILLDEPTSALDRPTADRLGETLRQIGRQLHLTIVMVTHDLRLAGRVANRLAYIEKGRLLESGPVSRLLAHPQTDALRNFLSEPLTGEEENSE
jgi:putative ABC transport system ATP-binding protein